MWCVNVLALCLGSFLWQWENFNTSAYEITLVLVSNCNSVYKYKPQVTRMLMKHSYNIKKSAGNNYRKIFFVSVPCIKTPAAQSLEASLFPDFQKMKVTAH